MTRIEVHGVQKRYAEGEGGLVLDGIDRAMFGSKFPVDGLYSGCDTLVDAYRALTRIGPRGKVFETLAAADPAVGAATREFLDAVEGRGRPTCSFAEACLSVRLIESAFESAARDGAWIAP